jgi:hypothetical protein
MSTKTFDAFISHSSSDAGTAAAIKKHLQSAGIRCWKAPDDILPGESWPEAILRAIADSKTMILVWSAHSKSSNEVGKELTLAMRHNLAVVPFRIENVPASSEWEYHLANTHWMDAFVGAPEQHFKLLVAHMAKLLPERTRKAGDAAEKPVARIEQIGITKSVGTQGANAEGVGGCVGGDRLQFRKAEIPQKTDRKRLLVRGGISTLLLIVFVILVVSEINDHDKRRAPKAAVTESVVSQSVHPKAREAAGELLGAVERKAEDNSNSGQPVKTPQSQEIIVPRGVEVQETRPYLSDMQQPVDEVFAAWRNLDLSRYISQWAPHSRKLDLKSGKTYNFQELSKERQKDFAQYKTVRADAVIKLRQSDSTHATFDVWYEMEFTRKTGKVFREKAKESYVVVKCGKQWLIELNRDYEGL